MDIVPYRFLDQLPLFLFSEADEVRNGLKRWNWLSFKKVKRQNTSETYFGINTWTVTEERKPNKGAYSDKLLLSHIWQKVNEAVSDQTFNICFKFSPIRSLKTQIGLLCQNHIRLWFLKCCFVLVFLKFKVIFFWKVWILTLKTKTEQQKTLLVSDIFGSNLRYLPIL